MTRPTRLLTGSAIILAVACASTQRAAERIPVEDRILLERAAIEAMCIEIPDMSKVSPEVAALCNALVPPVPSEGPVSGNGGPPGPGEGNGVRKVEP